VEENLSGSIQRVQRLDRCRQLHPVIRGSGLTTTERLAMLAGDQYDAPTARPGISPAGAVSEYLNDVGQNGFGIRE